MFRAFVLKTVLWQSSWNPLRRNAQKVPCRKRISSNTASGNRSAAYQAGRVPVMQRDQMAEGLDQSLPRRCADSAQPALHRSSRDVCQAIRWSRSVTVMERISSYR